MPTVTIAVRESHYPRDCLVFPVSRLRVFARLRLLSVRCLHLFTVHVPSLYQMSLRIPTSPCEFLRVARRFEYSGLTSYHVTTDLIQLYADNIVSQDLSSRFQKLSSHFAKVLVHHLLSTLCRVSEAFSGNS